MYTVRDWQIALFLANVRARQTGRRQFVRSAGPTWFVGEVSA